MKIKVSRISSLVFSVCIASLLLFTAFVITMPDVRAASCADDVLRVKKGASGAANGCSWEDAFSDLQLALAAAEGGDQVWVASGVYTPGLLVSDTFEIPSAVKVYGGFAGSEDELDQRDWQTHPTVLSGDIGGDDVVDAYGVVLTTTNIVGDNSYHVVLFDGASTPVTETTHLDGFFITAGDYQGVDGGGGGLFCNGNGVGSNCSPVLNNLNFSGNQSNRWGGAMLIDGAEGGNSSPSLTNIVFYHNSVDENGGGAAIWAYAGTSIPNFMTVTFRANSAGSIKTAGVGGGLNNNDGNPVLINVLFEDNTAAYGGGMSTGGGSPILTDVTFISNTATIDGGGLANDAYGYLRLSDVQFMRNYALRHGGGMFNYFYGSAVMERVVFLENSTDGLGGGLSNYTGSNTIITDGVFTNNSAGLGGGIMNFDNDMTLVNGDFRGNKAEWGAGMYNDMSVLTMTNVVVSGNYSEKEGGGIVNDGSFVEMNNVTLSGNVSELSGGGMYSRFENDISVNNSIFWDNKDSSGIGTITATSTISENSIVTLTNSLVQGSGGSADWQAVPHVDGGGNLAGDPLFVEPISLTVVPTSTGSFRLRSGSPAIDAGRNDLVPDGITEDLDGNPRIVNGLVDMGAYEWFQYRSYLPIVWQE